MPTVSGVPSPTTRTRPDACPGVVSPHAAADSGPADIAAGYTSVAPISRYECVYQIHHWVDTTAYVISRSGLSTLLAEHERTGERGG